MSEQAFGKDEYEVTELEGAAKNHAIDWLAEYFEDNELTEEDLIELATKKGFTFTSEGYLSE